VALALRWPWFGGFGPRVAVDPRARRSGSAPALLERKQREWTWVTGSQFLLWSPNESPSNGRGFLLAGQGRWGAAGISAASWSSWINRILQDRAEKLCGGGTWWLQFSPSSALEGPGSEALRLKAFRSPPPYEVHGFNQESMIFYAKQRSSHRSFLTSPNALTSWRAGVSGNSGWFPVDPKRSIPSQLMS
jgi:hypothetical protein